MPEIRYLPPETSREAKAKYRLRPEFRFTASQERAAARRHKADQHARKERTRQATLKRKKKEKDEQRKAEREAERLAANELIRRAREGGFGRVEEGGPLRPSSSQLPLFGFFPPQLPLPALDSIIPQQLCTPSPSNIRKPLLRQTSEQEIGFTLAQAWQLTQYSSQNPAIRSDSLVPTRPSPPYPIQKHPERGITANLEPALTETQDNAPNLDIDMGDNLHNTYDLNSSMPFSAVQWTSPCPQSPRRLQDPDMDREEVGKQEPEEEDEYPLSSSMVFALRNINEERAVLRLISEPDEYPISSQMELVFQDCMEELTTPRTNPDLDEYPLSSQTAAIFEVEIQNL